MVINTRCRLTGGRRLGPKTAMAIYMAANGWFTVFSFLRYTNVFTQEKSRSVVIFVVGRSANGEISNIT